MLYFSLFEYSYASVMCVTFVPNTHYFLSASKDKLIKYWNADNFEQILSLPSHHKEVWSLVVSPQGTFFVSASRDNSIRFWDELDEQVLKKIVGLCIYRFVFPLVKDFPHHIATLHLSLPQFPSFV